MVLIYKNFFMSEGGFHKNIKSMKIIHINLQMLDIQRFVQHDLQLEIFWAIPSGFCPSCLPFKISLKWLEYK